MRFILEYGAEVRILIFENFVIDVLLKISRVPYHPSYSTVVQRLFVNMFVNLHVSIFMCGVMTPHIST
jgi:hypothetical protein